MPTCPEMSSTLLTRRSSKSRLAEISENWQEIVFGPWRFSFHSVYTSPPLFNPILESLSTIAGGLRRTPSERAFFWWKEAANLNRLIKSKLRFLVPFSLSSASHGLTVFTKSSNYYRCRTSVVLRPRRVRLYAAKKIQKEQWICVLVLRRFVSNS